jgi:hypothetical protein
VTEMARDVLRVFRRRPEGAAPRAAQLPPGVAMEFEVRIPAGIAGSAITQLESGLHRAVTDRASALGVERGVTVHVTPSEAAGPTVAVWVAGRPLVVGLPAASGLPGAPGARAEDWAPNVVSAVDHALLRRLSFLLDAPLTQQHAARLQARLSDDRRDSYRGVPGYLLDNGISLAETDRLDDIPGLRQCDTAAEIGELLIDRLAPAEIVVEVAEVALGGTPAEGAAALVGAREALYAQTGLQFPDVRIVPTDEPPSVVRIQLNHVRLPEVRLAEASGWQDVVHALRAILAAFARWFLRVTSVGAARSQLADALPDLISLSRSLYPEPLLSACLRSLMVHGDSTRNLPRILWLLLEAGTVGTSSDLVKLTESPHLPSAGIAPVVRRDPELLACALRMQIAEEAWRVGVADPRDPCVCLPIDVENALIQPADTNALAEAERRAVEMVRVTKPPFRVVAHSASGLQPLQYALQALPEPPRVVASQELPPDTELYPVPVT